MGKVYNTSMGSYKNSKGELIHLSTKKLMQLLQEMPELTAIQDILNERDDYVKGGLVDSPLGAGGKR